MEKISKFKRTKTILLQTHIINGTIIRSSKSSSKYKPAKVTIKSLISLPNAQIQIFNKPVLHVSLEKVIMVC